MRAVVTGCAGFIGSHLTERLLDDGVSVTGIDAFAPTYDTSRRRAFVDRLGAAGGFEFVEGNILEVDMRPFVATADVVFHLAARPGVRASWTDFASVTATNVLGTQRVLDAMVGTGARLVFASSSSVYGACDVFPTPENAPLAPISPYGVTKAACEALIGAYSSQFGVRAVSLRYFTVYGPRQRSDMAFHRWISAALREEPLPLFGDGSAVRDFTYVEDAVAATVQAGTVSEDGHVILNVAGGSAVSVAEVLEKLETTIGHPINIDRSAPAKGDPDRTQGDTTQAKELLGWQPQHGLDEGLSRQVAWQQDLG